MLLLCASAHAERPRAGTHREMCWALRLKMCQGNISTCRDKEAFELLPWPLRRWTALGSSLDALLSPGVCLSPGTEMLHISLVLGSSCQHQAMRGSVGCHRAPESGTNPSSPPTVGGDIYTFSGWKTPQKEKPSSSFAPRCFCHTELGHEAIPQQAELHGRGFLTKTPGSPSCIPMPWPAVRPAQQLSPAR